MNKIRSLYNYILQLWQKGRLCKYLSQSVKKLAMVLATSISMIQAGIKAKIIAQGFIINSITMLFKCNLCIDYQVCFKKDQAKV